MVFLRVLMRRETRDGRCEGRDFTSRGGRLSLDMSTDSHQLFSWLGRLHARARTLLGGGEAAAPTTSVYEDAAPAGLERLTRAIGLTGIDEQIVLTLLAAELDPVIRLVERAVQRDASGWMELAT